MCVCVRRAKSDIVGREIEAASARSVSFHGRCAVRGEWSAITYLEEYQKTLDSKDILILGAFFECVVLCCSRKDGRNEALTIPPFGPNSQQHHTTPHQNAF